MEVSKASRDSATVILGKSEIITLANALNETLEALDDWEIPIRVGANNEEIEQLHRELSAILEEMAIAD